MSYYYYSARKAGARRPPFGGTCTQRGGSGQTRAAEFNQHNLPTRGNSCDFFFSTFGLPQSTEQYQTGSVMRARMFRCNEKILGRLNVFRLNENVARPIASTYGGSLFDPWGSFLTSGGSFGMSEEGCGIWVVVDGKRLQPIEVALIYEYMINTW